MTEPAAPAPPSTAGPPAGPNAGPAAEPAEVAERWRPPLFWRCMQVLARIVLPLVCRIRVTGEVPKELRDGPLILAGNHIANFDPFIVAAATHTRGISPRMMATGGLFRASIVGPLMRAAGHIPVDRGQATIANAVTDAADAIHAGSVVFIYPEGRIGLDPGLWPERPKTGLARLALATDAPVIPVAVWGSHEVIAYHGSGAMVRTLISSIWRRPRVKVHFGAPVDLTGLQTGAVGHAQRASDRIMEALTVDLASLRSDELGLPRYRDPTRPVSTARSAKRR